MKQNYQCTEAVIWRCSVKKEFLENLESSQGKTFPRKVFFHKVASLLPVALFKKNTPAQALL